MEALQQRHIESLAVLHLHLFLRFKEELQLLDSRDDPHTCRRQGCRSRISSALNVSGSVSSTSTFFSQQSPACDPVPVSALLSSLGEVITPVLLTLSYVLLKPSIVRGALCNFTEELGLAPEALAGFSRVIVSCVIVCY